MSKFRQLNHEDTLKLMAECANFGVWDLVRKDSACLIHMDGCASSAFGLPNEEVTMDFFRLTELCHEDDQLRLQAEIQELTLQPGREKTIEFRVWSDAEKEWRWVRSFCRSYEADKPDLIHIIGSTQNIPDSPASQSLINQMNEANERTQIMLDAMPLCCNFWDENYNNIDCNQEAAKLFDLSSKQEYLDNFHKLSPEYQPDGTLSSEKARAHIKEAFEKGRVVFEWMHQKLNGDAVPSEITLVRVKRGGSYTVVGYTRDLREFKKMMADIRQGEDDLRLARDAAEESARSKSEFLANMSHEIRTPMNAIKGLAELLALTELNSMQRSYIHNIVKSSNSLLSIINDVLDFSKINANKVELVEGTYLLEELIAEVSNVVSLRASEKGLMLLMEISPSLPRSLVGDDVRVKQVLINILNNAVKYTPEGHVTLRLSGEETEAGFELVCTVKDTGIGIRQEDIPFLFEAFSQADRRANHHIQGTGLGLSISEQLVRSMGGSITVESEYGKGSAFTVRFPQRIENREPLAAVEKPEKKHVLLLERDARVQCATYMLEELGIAYTTAAAAEDLESIAAGQCTHCIYDDSFSEKIIRRIRGRMPDCVFIAMKDMRYAMDQSELHDAVLFIPLLITELAKVLSRDPQQRSQEPFAGKSIDDFALADAHVLVVDDNEINLLVSGEILRAYKADVTCAESGREALDLCAENQYDLIFMDHMMPEMDGMETTIALRSHEGPNRSTPVVALTANVINDMRSQYLQCGMDDFISKPIEIADLSRVLLQWLPGSKITTMALALQPEPPAPPAPTPVQESPMENLIQSMDAFGMYVSDVMREIGSDYDVYIRRMDRVRTDLTPLVARLREEVHMENWAGFATDVSELSQMIHDVGARDCSGRARKLANAAREQNADYIRGDFFSLMDNMYMLTKKMEVAVPIALGNISPDVPFGDISYCYDRLLDMQSALAEQDYETCEALLDSLAHYSLDHALDLILVDIGAKLSTDDYSGASVLHEQAVQHCRQFLK